VANEDDVTGSLSSLRVTYRRGSDDDTRVEMLPAACGVESDDESEIENEKPSRRLS